MIAKKHKTYQKKLMLSRWLLKNVYFATEIYKWIQNLSIFFEIMGNNASKKVD